MKEKNTHHNNIDFYRDKHAKLQTGSSNSTMKCIKVEPHKSTET